MGNIPSLFSSLALEEPYRDGRKIDVVNGQVRNRILVSTIGKAGRTKAEVLRLLLDDIDAVTGEPRALDDEPTSAANFASMDETGRRRVLLGRFTPIRAIAFAELQLQNRWQFLRPRPRPVFVTVSGIGGAIIIAQRRIDDDEQSSLALSEDLGLFAVQKVAPIDPRFIRVTAPPLEVPAVAQYVNVNIERLIVTFRPDRDFVQVMQSDGITYNESWSRMLQSTDERDVTAINILRRDFPTMWMHTSLVPGEKSDEVRFPGAAPAAQEIMSPVSMTLDDPHGQPQTFNMVEQLMTGDEYSALVARERWVSATAALGRSSSLPPSQYYTNNVLMSADEHDQLQQRLAANRIQSAASTPLVQPIDIRNVVAESATRQQQQQPVPTAIGDEVVAFVSDDDDDDDDDSQ